MDIAISSPKRFKVALSFAGEYRSYVESVALELQKLLSPTAIFYDNFYIHELARPNLDTYLLRIYREQSELVAVFLCEAYSTKEWCGLEWRAVRDMIKAKQTIDIMPFVFGQFDLMIEGFLSIDGYIRVGSRSPEATADLIVKRLEIRQAEADGKAVVEIILEQPFDTYTEKEIEALAKLIREVIKDEKGKIFSRRRGSLIVTLILDQQQIYNLLEQARSGAFVGKDLLEIKRSGEVLYRNSELSRRGSPEKSQIRIPNQARGSGPWAVRYTMSKLLIFLLEDLMRLEKTGITSSQCGMVKHSIVELANIASSIPSNGIFTEPLYRDIEKFESIYGAWNDIQGGSPQAAISRSNYLKELRKARHRIMRKASTAVGKAIATASSADLQYSRRVIDAVVRNFTEVVNLGEHRFPHLRSACADYKVLSEARAEYN